MSVPPSLRRLAVPAAACSLLAVGFAGGAFTVHSTLSRPSATSHPARHACPGAGSNATSSQRDRAENCETADRVAVMLRHAGARDVNVSVTRSDSDSLLGPAQRLDVVAQVTLPPGVQRGWNVSATRRSIAAVAGTTADRVEVVDEKLIPLSTGSSGPSSPPSTPPR